LYKDRADPVALPDADYPEWLWTILDESAALTTHSGVTLEATAGLSKGEARAAQKRNLRAVRSAQRGMPNRDSGAAAAGAGMNAVGAASDGEVAMPAGQAQILQAEAAMAVEGASKRSVEAEMEARKALRRANREKIKSRNFLSKR
jgi:large subunit ribosomal protein L54